MIKTTLNRIKEQHEPEIKQPKFVHFVIQAEPNNTIGLYEDGKPVKSIDFWIEDLRENDGGDR